MVSYSAKRTMLGSTSSPNLIVFQSRPWNLASPVLVGGLFSSSCMACCVRDGCRDARGEVGVPRICSAKLPRCARGSGLELILRAGGAWERPIDAVELLIDWLGDGDTSPSFAFARSSAMAEDAIGAVWGGVEGAPCSVVMPLQYEADVLSEEWQRQLLPIAHQTVRSACSRPAGMRGAFLPPRSTCRVDALDSLHVI
jgi:hypothetical protein